MRLPSADQAGQVSMVGLVVSLRGSAPSAFITQMSKLPLRALANAICLPSGDQQGLLSMAGSLVSCLGFLPSASQTQMSCVLALVLTHAICLPSGDQRGDSSQGPEWGMLVFLPVPSRLPTSFISLASVPSRW